MGFSRLDRRKRMLRVSVTVLILATWTVLVVSPLEAQMFIRGDANGDGNLNLDDSVFLAAYLYSGGAPPPVESAGNANDNGAVELGDITTILEFAFLSGSFPPAPFPFPGTDPTPGPFDPPLDPMVEISLPDQKVVPGQSGLSLQLSISTASVLNGVEVALTYDPATITVEGFDVGNSILGTAGAEFIRQEVSTDPADPYAWLGAIVDWATPIDGHFMPAGDDLPLALLQISIDPAANAPQVTQIAYTDGVGSPPKRNLVVLNDGETRRPSTTGGMIEVEVVFIRSDSNHDCVVDVSDVIYSVSWLFQGGPDHPCDDAADTNNDGIINLADPVYLLNYLFQDGPAPSEPFPLSGLDPDSDALDCAQQSACAGM